jgi:hypothetical protein
MASRIVNQAGAFHIPKRKAMKDSTYATFLHELPCVISRSFSSDIEACHVSFANRELGHFGRGRGTKAADRWQLPMRKEHHDRQHSMDERSFWESHLIDPHLACLILWGLFTEAGMDAVPEARRIIQEGLR